jgi:hypothetical protein
VYRNNVSGVMDVLDHAHKTSQCRLFTDFENRFESCAFAQWEQISVGTKSDLTLYRAQGWDHRA